MSTAAASPSTKGKLVVKNIGLCLSGALESPILDADTIVAVDGVIEQLWQAGRCRYRQRRYRRRRAGDHRVPRPDRQPRPPGVWRLDSPPEPAQLDRQHDERRRHQHDLSRRGAFTGKAEGCDRGQSTGGNGAARFHEHASRRREGACRRAGDRAGHGRTGFQGDG